MQRCGQKKEKGNEIRMWNETDTVGKKEHCYMIAVVSLLNQIWMSDYRLLHSV